MTAVSGVLLMPRTKLCKVGVSLRGRDCADLTVFSVYVILNDKMKRQVQRLA